MQQSLLEFETRRRIYSVSELNTAIHAVLEAEFTDVWVTGEISGVRLATSGHYYFTLKDREAQVRCACFRMTARYLRFKPQDGVFVLARGRIDVYTARGEYQMLVDHLEPQGHGALQFAFDELKKKLAADGLFEAARKRPIPKLPTAIGIVTSPQGAVIQDMLNILSRRFPGLHIRVFPAAVQGEGSVEAVCRGLRYFSESEWADVVILARGGGSLEDLWTFNEEPVARAIAASRPPVISAVGHETDFTIADFVADLRAPTPSAAAELVVCTREQLFDQLTGCSKTLEQLLRYRLSMEGKRLHQLGVDRAVTTLHRSIGRRLQMVDETETSARHCIADKLKANRRKLDVLVSDLRRLDLRVRFAETRHRLEAAGTGLNQGMALELARCASRFAPLSATLTQLSPLRILERGYAIVQDIDGRVVKDADEAPEGSDLSILLARGKLTARVTTPTDSSELPS